MSNIDRRPYRCRPGLARRGYMVLAWLAVGMTVPALHANDWLDTTGLDWSLDADQWSDGEPSATDLAYVGESTAPDAHVTISQSGEVAGTLNIAYGRNGTVTMLGGDLAITDPGGRLLVGTSGDYTGIFDQHAGDVFVSNTFGVGYSQLGIYRLRGGTLELGGGITSRIGSGTGLFVQTGGQVTVSSHIYLGWTADTSVGIYELVDGTLEINGANKYIYVGHRGQGTFLLGNAQHSDGALIDNSAATNGAEFAGLIIQNSNDTADGVFRGWGTVGLTGNLQVSGKVIADGYGIDRTLDMSAMLADNRVLGQSKDNTSDNGWYAVRGGRLLLPDVTVTAGASRSANWGEAPADTILDMINSVQLTLSDTSTGPVSLALLATDRADIPTPVHPVSPTTGQPVTLMTVWEIVSLPDSFADLDLTVRYDDGLGFGGDRLRLMRYDTAMASWVELSTLHDDANMLLTASDLSFADLSSTTHFAVAVLPEPASALGLLVGAMVLTRRRGRAARRHPQGPLRA